MVDVGAKPVTARRAVAEAHLVMSRRTAELLAEGGLPKGDALAVARVAGIMAAKQTPTLIPLCHPVRVSSVTVDLEVRSEEGTVVITAVAGTEDRTGVEMEAMTAATVAALTLYDMVKGVERGVRIAGIALLEKTGGRSGHWHRDPTNAGGRP